MGDQPTTYLPFRPYMRFKSEVISLTEVHRRAQCAAIDGQVEYQEIARIGGYNAVVEVIRRHFPEFDATLAQQPNDVSWIKLKPVLIRAGLPVDESVTLSDIYAFLDGPKGPNDSSELSTYSDAQTKESSMSNTVFVVHGRHALLRLAMFDFLRSLGLSPIEWPEAIRMTGKGAPTTPETLDAAFDKPQAVIVILNGEDWAVLAEAFQKDDDPVHEKQPTLQPRPNVLFEAGMAFGRHPDRTILVRFSSIRSFSDIAGRHLIDFDGSAKSRQTLKAQLKNLGCSIQDHGTDWMEAGDFSKCQPILAPQLSPNRSPRRGKPKK